MTGAETRFNQLFDAHHAAILGYLVRRCDQPADAADLLADVYTTAWRRLERIPDGTDARLWLFAVARKSLLNYRRGQRRRHQLADRLRQELAVGHRADPDFNEAAHAALAMLAPKDREVVLLTAWEELTPSEVAVVLRVRTGTVRVRLHRARKRLRKLIEDGSAAGAAPTASHRQLVVSSTPGRTGQP